MANKSSSKSYNSNSSRRSNYKNYTKQKNSSNSNYKKRKSDLDDDFDVTTRIRVDENRINDADSLDVSFLEKKSRKINTSKKEKILNNRNVIFDDLSVIKSILFGFGSLCILILLFLVLKNNSEFLSFFSSVSDSDDDVIVSDDYNPSNSKTDVVSDKVIDDNILFVGDFFVDGFNLEDFDYPYVKVFDDKLNTKSLLNDLKSKVYDFNPSVIFIHVGIYDLNDDISDEDFINELNDVIDKIKDNRPYAEIYIDSLIPINENSSDYDSEFFNDCVSNDKINTINTKILSLTNEKKVNYFDLYDLLVDDNGNLSGTYSNDGIHLNEKGYEMILNKIDKIVVDEV